MLLRILYKDDWLQNLWICVLFITQVIAYWEMKSVNRFNMR